MPITDHLAAISVGVVDGKELLDLCYEEDSRAGVDMNVIGLASGKLIEVQATAEGQPYDRATLDRLLDLAQSGIGELIEIQRQALGEALAL
jgi:ribonuclease PH